MDKYKLLNDFFDLGGNHRLEESKMLETNLLDYIENNGEDSQIRDALRVLQLYRVEAIYNDHETCCCIAAPILERMASTCNWDVYDILLFTTVVGYAETYIQAYILAEDVLKRLEEYSNEKWYAGAKLTVHMNIMLRLLRTKHFDSENLVSLNELKKMFLQHTTAAFALFKSRKFLIFEAVATIRKGLFYKDDDLTMEGFKLLGDNGEFNAYKVMQHEVRQFEFLAELTITRKQYDAIIGGTVRQLRLDRNMTTEELAELLDVSPWSIGQFERGERGMSGLTIRKLADIFGVSTDALYYGPMATSLESNHHENQLQMLLAYARELAEDEMDYLLSNVRSLLRLSRGKNKTNTG